MKFINKINTGIGKSFAWLLLIMVVLTCIIVVLRYLFNIGFIWMQELVRFCYAMVFLACAAYTLAEDEHVRVDIIYSNLSNKSKSIINIIGSIIFVIPVCLVIIYYSFNYVVNSWAQLEGSLEERGLHAVYILKSFIWIFAIMLIFQSLSIIYTNLYNIRKKD
tara:strand:+ start:347 stop:835 length:489 start_codon:yes stop_codon:yes gene_type:complete